MKDFIKELEQFILNSNEGGEIVVIKKAMRVSLKEAKQIVSMYKRKIKKIEWRRAKQSFYDFNNEAWVDDQRVGYIQERSDGYGWWAFGKMFFEDVKTIEEARLKIEKQVQHCVDVLLFNP